MDRLVEKELIEISPDQRSVLITEIVSTGADARNPKHLLRRVVKTLLRSDNVEEIYATDEQIISIFQEALTL